MEKGTATLNYPVFTDAALEKMNQFISEMEPSVSQIYILADENTHLHCIAPLVRNVSAIENAEIIEIDAGEDQKNLEIVHRLWQVLAENNVDRQALIVNLGGGVVCDMGGFMASVYKRGIRFVNIPTSLLAMVDAAIGGKTGIDLGSIKNQLGSFSNPEAVFIWPEFLKTLPDEEVLSGFGEIIKYALIDNIHFWEVIHNLEYDDITDFSDFIVESIAIKSKVVDLDPYEKSLRKVLNFGHTYGHALESLSLMRADNSKLSHGKAVALGIIFELWHSVQKANFPESDFEDIKDYILGLFGPFPIDSSDIEPLIEFMKKDKKNADNRIAVVLLREIGKPLYNEFITEDEILDCITYYQSIRL